ncbi:MAG: hypothetical protein KatS3mg115_0334 [Candidatus Poribacteria bacterium]|nr:MAG: hypothetical protein KatS3mg115_0334 [Candidatus Poribacteria bacterium]
MVVTFHIYEGPQFVFEGYEIQIEDPNPEITEEQVREVLRLEPGDVFNATTYREDLLRVQELYGNRGNILANVHDELDQDTASETVRARLHIREGSTIHIGEVRIEGAPKNQGVRCPAGAGAVRHQAGCPDEGF